MYKIVFIILTILSSNSFADEAILLFGGEGHKEFIGCMNCGKYDQSSICNKYGEYGSKYNQKSIWNKYGNYGSKYSNDSPWNKYASNPPILVDKNGGFYGYFASNKYQSKRTEIELFKYMLDNVDIILEDLDKSRDWFCDDA